MFLKYPGMVLHLALTWQVKILGFSIWDETCSIAQKFNLAVHHSYQNKLWSLSIPFIFWAKSEVVVAEVTIHYLQLFHYVSTLVTVCGWPLQTILDTLLERPQLLANLQNGPSRKHFIRRRRILIAINAINVEETQPHCVHSLNKKELLNIFQYSSTEYEFPNLSLRKTFIPFIHVRLILCLLKYHDICEEEDFLLQ